MARDHGAIVYERFNEEQVGEGYALDYLFDKLKKGVGDDYYDAYVIIDADNLLDEHFFEAVNKTFCQGYRIMTTYRNSKNFATNWISAGYSLWFMREAKFLNNCPHDAGYQLCGVGPLPALSWQVRSFASAAAGRIAC